MAENDDNLRFWRKMANVPKEHLKSFTRGGGFRGTDIKPQWRFQAMTETFGPCGHGWGMERPEFRIERDQVYCIVGVWTKGSTGLTWGVGGEALSGRGDDEAFKKAYTDALGNAMAKLGVASDIYMGFYDGSKYVRQTTDEDAPEQERGVVEQKTAYRAKQDGDGEEYKRIDRGLNLISEKGSLDDLRMFWKANYAKIETMPQGWIDELTAKKDLIKAAFESGLNKPLNPYEEGHDPKTGEIE